MKPFSAVFNQQKSLIKPFISGPPKLCTLRIESRPFRLFAATLLAAGLVAFSLPAQAQNDNTVYGDGALDGPGLTGSYNSAFGASALTSNQDGDSNTACGAFALIANVSGDSNTAVGEQALRFVIGSENTGIGADALSGLGTGDPVTGWGNTATGFRALYSVSSGGSNVADGSEALYSNTTGGGNVALGEGALTSNITGNFNTATGAGALFLNHGANNTANGAEALGLNNSGANNVALGYRAGFNLTTGNNNIDIGNAGVAAEANKIRIGTVGTQTATFIAGISGAGVSGAAVKINAAGQLGTAPSSRRFKDQIEPMNNASEAILALKPVTFHYKKELDPEGTRQFGLVAEEVAQVNRDLVECDAHGKIYTVRYEAVNAMLLNEFLKEHRKVEQLGATVAKKEKEFEAKLIKQQEQIEALTTGLQKVGVELERNKRATQLVLNKE
jgi:hypothetical protein